MAQVWYLAEPQNVNVDQAQKAFDEAVALFGSKLSNGASGAKWLSATKATSITDIFDYVKDARSRYEMRRGSSKVRDSLSRFSERVHHYGNIMDVFVQHHPEYVSLAWGTMKLLFVGVVNHERALTTLTNALSEIADKLPRVELAAHLYSTTRMKNAVSTLYSYILQFYMKAHGWYQEGRLSHALHSLTRPHELHYDEILAKISSQSLVVKDLAVIGSQVEQRDMHVEQKAHSIKQQEMDRKLDELTTLVTQLKDVVITSQRVNVDAHIQVQQSLSDIQLSHVISIITTSVLIDQHETLRFSLLMRNTRYSRRRSKYRHAFWNDDRIQYWTTSRQSSLIVIKGTRRSRFSIQDFCTNVIEFLHERSVPTLWILRSAIQDEDCAPHQPSPTEIIKSLISQALRINCGLNADYKMSSRLQMYLNASTEAQWFALLAAALEGLSMVYIVIDMEALGPAFAIGPSGFSWITAFQELFQGLAAKEIKAIVKVLLVNYGSPLSIQATSDPKNRELIVQVQESKKGAFATGRHQRSKISGTGFAMTRTCGLPRRPPKRPARVPIWNEIQDQH